jgi:hypothetical protein
VRDFSDLKQVARFAGERRNGRRVRGVSAAGQKDVVDQTFPTMVWDP